jgi:hypothetical protein
MLTNALANVSTEQSLWHDKPRASVYIQIRDHIFLGWVILLFSTVILLFSIGSKQGASF